MKQRYLYFFYIILLLLIVPAQKTNGATLSIPSNFTFQNNLSFGQTKSPDVSFLQNLLNSNQATIVAETGPGSNTGLTNTFGNKTLDAVKRFQNLYKNEVLTPAGLTNPTGFFGPLSRKKANSLLLSGSNTNSFQTNNTINHVADSVFSANTFGTTNNPLLPNITSLSPLIAPDENTGISIFGKNFTDDNTIYGTIGAIKNLPAIDGRIMFPLKNFSGYSAALGQFAGQTIDIYLRVSNINGYSNNLAVVRYTFPGNILRTSANTNTTSTNTTSTSETSTTDTAAATESAPTETTSSATTGSSSSSSSSSQNSQSSLASPSGVIDNVKSMDKQIFGLSPQGQLIKLIGGNSALDTVYKYSPSSILLTDSKSALNGELPGSTLTGKNISALNPFGGSSNSSTNSAGAAGGLLGALGLGGGIIGTSGTGAAGTGANGLSNFGGQITNVTQCTCNTVTGSKLIYVNDVRGYQVQVLYTPGQSILWREYNLSPGVNVLGNYYPGGVCMVVVSYYPYTCSSSGSPNGTIYQVGTSIR